MTENLLIFQATVGVNSLSSEDVEKHLDNVNKKLESILEQENYIVKIITVPDWGKEPCVDIKLVYPIYNLIDKDTYDKHIGLHEEIDKIKKELESKVD